MWFSSDSISAIYALILGAVQEVGRAPAAKKRCLGLEINLITAIGVAVDFKDVIPAAAALEGASFVEFSSICTVQQK